MGSGGLEQHVCHVGHAYAPLNLLAAVSEELEAALWACVRMLRENATLTRQTAHRAQARGDAATAQRIEEQADLDERNLRVIRQTLLEAAKTPTQQTAEAVLALDANGAVQHRQAEEQRGPGASEYNPIRFTARRSRRGDP